MLPQLTQIEGVLIMKKSMEIDAIRAVSFHSQESVRDLFIILQNLLMDMEKIKTILKDKKFIE